MNASEILSFFGLDLPKSKRATPTQYATMKIFNDGIQPIKDSGLTMAGSEAPSSKLEVLLEEELITTTELEAMRNPLTDDTILQAVVEAKNWKLFQYLMQIDDMKSLLYVQSGRVRHHRTVFGILAGQGDVGSLKQRFLDCSIDPKGLSYDDIQVMLGSAIANGQIKMLNYLKEELDYKFDANEGFYVAGTTTATQQLQIFSPLVAAALNGNCAMVMTVIKSLPPSEILPISQKVPGDLLLATVKGGSVELLDFLLQQRYYGMAELERHIYGEGASPVEAGFNQEINHGRFEKGDTCISVCSTPDMLRYIVEKLQIISDGQLSRLMERILLNKNIDMLLCMKNSKICTADKLLEYYVWAEHISLWEIPRDHPLVLVAKKGNIELLQWLEQESAIGTAFYKIFPLFRIACEHTDNLEAIKFLASKTSLTKDFLTVRDCDTFIKIVQARKVDILVYLFGLDGIVKPKLDDIKDSLTNPDIQWLKSNGIVLDKPEAGGASAPSDDPEASAAEAPTGCCSMLDGAEKESRQKRKLEKDEEQSRSKVTRKSTS